MSISAVSLASSSLFNAATAATTDHAAQSGAALGAGRLADADPDLCPKLPKPHPHSLSDLLSSLPSLTGASLGSQARFLDEFCGNGPRPPLPHGI